MGQKLCNDVANRLPYRLGCRTMGAADS